MILYIFPVFWLLHIHLKLLEQRIITSFFFVCNEIVSLGTIFDSAVFSTIWPQAQFEVLHSEAIRRKRDSTHQDVAFFRRRFVAFGRQKSETEAGALCASRYDVF